jgi:SAM-dependent methyltransferase
MARALDALQRRVKPPANVLDLGSYFGNFSLMLAWTGFKVDAVDSYRAYDHALDSVVGLMCDSGIRVRELGETLPDNYYDAVLLMGVIEHVPHTPRHLLESVNRALRPGGYLITDTPNLAYVYNRQKLSKGESPFSPISAQYYTELPFEGHHREYTVAEMQWMLEQLQHEEINLDTFFYSIYSLQQLAGLDLENYISMRSDPLCRELIFSISRKPNR